MNARIKSLAIDIKQQTRIKLPDAIVAATAMEYRLLLVTADKDFEKISNLNLLLMNIS
jgi:predicted nucleic acid-binding protein